MLLSYLLRQAFTKLTYEWKRESLGNDIYRVSFDSKGHIRLRFYQTVNHLILIKFEISNHPHTDYDRAMGII